MRAWLVLVLLAGCTSPLTPPGEDPRSSLSCPPPCETTIHGGPEWVFEPDVASNPLDPDHLVAVTSDFGADGKRQIFSHVSRDAGATWTRHQVSAGFGDPVVPALSACDYAFDPVVAFRPDGTALLAGIAASREENALTGVAFVDLFVATSLDGARFDSFAFPQADDPRVGCAGGSRTTLAENLQCAPGCRSLSARTSADKPWIHVADGAITVTVQQATAVSYTSTDAVAWEGPVPVPVAVDGAYPYSIDMATGPDGIVAASTSVVPVAGGWSLEHLNFHRHDGQWSSTLLETNATAYPQIAAHGERIYIAYASGNSSASRQDVWLTWSDGGAWQRVLIDRAQAPGPVLPTLAVDDAGRAFLGFYHYLPNRIEYRAAMFDGDVSVVRVDTTPILEQHLGLALGHYMGAAPQPEGAYLVWVSGKAPDTALHGARVLPDAVG